LEDYKWQALASQAADALKNGLLDQALAMYTQLIEKDPRQPLYQYNVGTIYLMLRRPEDALPHYKSARKLDPGNKVYVESLDKLEQGLKEAKEAKEKTAKDEATKNKAAKEWTAKTNAKPSAPKKVDLYANFGLDVKSSRLGVMVKRLKPGWRGAQVGLSVNDIIKNVDGVDITQVAQLEQILGNKPIGERFQMILIRRGMACQLTF
jgi:tetratricopeptide (TPR) repeat protein